jgi:carbonic anhydrase
VVQWFVLREPIPVPALYFDQLRDILDAQGNKITKNYRELQDLNGRVVKRLELSNKEDERTQ